MTQSSAEGHDAVAELDLAWRTWARDFHGEIGPELEMPKSFAGGFHAGYAVASAAQAEREVTWQFRWAEAEEYAKSLRGEAVQQAVAAKDERIAELEAENARLRAQLNGKIDQ